MPPYLVLARKYRPATFSDVVGQEHVIRTLRNAIASGRVAHAFLFCGIRGVGKTTVARILAKSLNCTGRDPQEADPCDQCESCREIARGASVDVQEIDGASNTSVENVREINENIKYPPVSSPYKIIIIDEVHMISINAFNALLKTLEEPPAHAKFIFATTESHKVPATINSRCQRYLFRTISLMDIVSGMRRILDQEGIKATDDALGMIAREAQGSFRDALSLLDQVIALGAETIGAEDVANTLGLARREAFFRLVDAILSRNRTEVPASVHEFVDQGHDPEQLVLELIHFFRNLIVVKTLPQKNRPQGIIDAAAGELEDLERLAASIPVEELHNLLGMLIRSDADIKRSSNPWIIVEMTLLRMTYAPDIVSLSEIVSRIDSALAGGPAQETRATQRPVRELPPRKAPEPPKPPPPEPSSAEKALVEPEPLAPATPVQEEEPEPPHPATPLPREEPPPVARGKATGTPDEVWTELKLVIEETAADLILKSVMDHGSLIAFGPKEVEIGFNKDIYREQFEQRLKSKPALMEVFKTWFGGARLKIYTLSEKTSLDTKKPYGGTVDGQSDLHRALRNEAMEHPLTRTIQQVFLDSAIDEIRIIVPK